MAKRTLLIIYKKRKADKPLYENTYYFYRIYYFYI